MLRLRARFGAWDTPGDPHRCAALGLERHGRIIDGSIADMADAKKVRDAKPDDDVIDILDVAERGQLEVILGVRSGRPYATAKLAVDRATLKPIARTALPPTLYGPDPQYPATSGHRTVDVTITRSTETWGVSVTTGGVGIVEVATNKKIVDLRCGGGAWSEDGNVFACAAEDGELFVFDARTSAVRTLKLPCRPCGSKNGCVASCP